MVLNTVNWGIGGKGGAMRRLGPTFLNHPLRDKSARGPVGAVLALALSTLLTGLLAACGESGGAETLDGAPVAPYSPPAPSLRTGQAVTDPDAVFVLRSYRGFWAAQVRAMDTGRADGSDLSTYATGTALSESYADVVRLDSAGMVMVGAPRNHPVVTAMGPLPGSRTERQATVQDCLDVSGWHQVSVHGGATTEPGQRLQRYPLVVTVRTVGGAWMISDVVHETGRTC